MIQDNSPDPDDSLNPEQSRTLWLLTADPVTWDLMEGAPA